MAAYDLNEWQWRDKGHRLLRWKTVEASEYYWGPVTGSFTSLRHLFSSLLVKLLIEAKPSNLQTGASFGTPPTCFTFVIYSCGLSLFHQDNFRNKWQLNVTWVVFITPDHLRFHLVPPIQFWESLLPTFFSRRLMVPATMRRSFHYTHASSTRQKGWSMTLVTISRKTPYRPTEADTVGTKTRGKGGPTFLIRRQPHLNGGARIATWSQKEEKPVKPTGRLETLRWNHRYRMANKNPERQRSCFVASIDHAKLRDSTMKKIEWRRRRSVN